MIGNPSVQQVQHIPNQYRRMCFESLGSEPVPGILDEILEKYNATGVEQALIKGLIRWDPHERFSADQCLKLMEEEGIA